MKPTVNEFGLYVCRRNKGWYRLHVKDLRKLKWVRRIVQKVKREGRSKI